MDQAEYIENLWRLIGGLCVIVLALIGALWRHVLEDRRERMAAALELQRCKDALGLNGRQSDRSG